MINLYLRCELITMKKYLIISLLFVSCSRFVYHTNIKLDIKAFDAKQVNDTAQVLTPFKFEAQQIKYKDGSYMQTTSFPGSNDWRAYYYPSGRIRHWVLSACGMDYGSWPVYNENGDFLYSINYDKPFKFGYQALAKKFRREYKINLTTQSWSITRNTTNNTLVYRITVISENKARRFVIDGMTGKTLSDETITVALQETATNPGG